LGGFCPCPGRCLEAAGTTGALFAAGRAGLATGGRADAAELTGAAGAGLCTAGGRVAIEDGRPEPAGLGARTGETERFARGLPAEATGAGRATGTAVGAGGALLGTDTNGCTGAAFATGGVNTGGEMTGGGATVGAGAACTVGTADAGASNVVETAGRAIGTATGGTACCWVGRAGAGVIPTGDSLANRSVAARATGAGGGADELGTAGRGIGPIKCWACSAAAAAARARNFLPGASPAQEPG